MTVLLWKDLPAGAMLVYEGRDEPTGDRFWGTTVLLTGWGGGDKDRGTGFLALSCELTHVPKVYAFATACTPSHLALDQTWILPRKTHEVG